MNHNRSAALERSVKNYWGGLKPILRVPNLALGFYYGSKHLLFGPHDGFLTHQWINREKQINQR